MQSPALERLRSGTKPLVKVGPDAVARFGRIMRERLTGGEVPFRRAYLGAIIDRIEVDETEIRIMGRKDVLEQSVLATAGPVPGLRSFVRNWRSLGDFNISTYSVAWARVGNLRLPPDIARLRSVVSHSDFTAAPFQAVLTALIGTSCMVLNPGTRSGDLSSARLFEGGAASNL